MKTFITLAFTLPLVLAGCTAEEQALPSTEIVLDAVDVDPDHYAVEFENDVIQVIRISYGPGEGSAAMHSHPASCVIFITDTSFEMTPRLGESTADDWSAGDVVCGDAEVHSGQNLGGDAEAVMIALKGREAFDAGATSPAVTRLADQPDAVTADQDHYSVEFENDLLRVLRIRYGIGERSVMHAHPAGCAIFLREQNVQFTLPDGTVEEQSDQPGDVTCSDAGAHLPENIGDAPFELILVELKDRATIG